MESGMIDKCLAETHKHVRIVGKNINLFIINLLNRAIRHDDSKFEEPELSGFAEAQHKLSACEYGSDEYKANLEELKPILNHHYLKNRHHTEYHSSNEAWVAIEGYEGIYEVSNLGRVQSLTRTIEREKAGNFLKGGKVLTPTKTPVGYYRLALSKNGVSKNFLVHQLVAKAFIENERNKPFVNHIDGDKANNTVDNLEWVTSSENLVHAYDTGLKEAKVKYYVYCPELSLATRGIQKMEALLREKGYEKASAASIWAVLNGQQNTHLDLIFESITPQECLELNSMVSQMTLCDLVEMLCDWRAAAQRNKDGDIRKSLAINAEKYGMSSQLTRIFENTIKEEFSHE